MLAAKWNIISNRDMGYYVVTDDVLVIDYALQKTRRESLLNCF